VGVHSGLNLLSNKPFERDIPEIALSRGLRPPKIETRKCMLESPFHTQTEWISQHEIYVPVALRTTSLSLERSLRERLRETPICIMNQSDPLSSPRFSGLIRIMFYMYPERSKSRYHFRRMECVSTQQRFQHQSKRESSCDLSFPRHMSQQTYQPTEIYHIKNQTLLVRLQ